MIFTGNGLEINCAEFTDKQILASELLGHEKDSWEKAYCRKIGLIEVATGMTLTLVNSHCIPEFVRAQLDSGQYYRLGGNESKTVKCNLIWN